MGALAQSAVPIHHYHDLVAGEGAPGYRDGLFSSALFNSPGGLALDAGKNDLYVADRDNNRIRIIHLSESNRVETLAGSGKAGHQDGSFTEARFRHPTALVFLPPGRLVVYDSENHFFRLIDLQTRTVSTLAGNGKDGCSDGPATEAALGGVWSLAFSRQENAVYFSQPADGALRRMDLSQNKIQTLLKKDVRLPKPKALCLEGNSLYAANDGAKTDICLFQLPKDTSTPPVFQRKVGVGESVAALAVSDSGLYVLQADSRNPWVRLTLDKETGAVALGFRSVWGGKIQPGDNRVPPLLEVAKNEPAGLIQDPQNPKSFFVASKYLEGVLSLKDYSFEQLIQGEAGNSEGIPEFEYPLEKPTNTFRILIVGDSRPFYQTNGDEKRWGWTDHSGGGNRMESMPKRLELMLNTEAALEESPVHFEVLNSCLSGNATFLGLCYQALRLADQYQIDLILYFPTSSLDDVSRSCHLYFLRPLTPEGIPQEKTDPEYLLKPWQAKIPDGPPKQFYEYCLSKGWVRPSPPSQLTFSSFDKIFHDPAARARIKLLMGKPLEVFKGKWKESRKGRPTKAGFLMCFVPFRDAGPSPSHLDELENLRAFWGDLAQSNGLPFLDLTDPLTSLSKTYWPLDEEGYGQHFNANGHFLFAYLLAHELIQGKVVPLDQSSFDANRRQDRAAKP